MEEVNMEDIFTSKLEKIPNIFNALQSLSLKKNKQMPKVGLNKLF